MPHNRPWLRTAIGTAGLALLLAARATSIEARPVPAADFEPGAWVTTLASPRAVAAVVDCFAATAAVPSFAHLARSGDGAELRLRFDGFVFETISFRRAADGGTAVRVALSGRYTGADRAHFAAARGRPLTACLTPMTGVPVAAQ